ncbi:golgin candidate 4 [Ipomoea triloba]|uniref:golgin candidate 4 n=1 Tax=Ipomoea triloba TaxID=35885 RepID=UPI00125CEA8D|nr:golgin candidate 4 [Ipomoea triloba]
MWSSIESLKENLNRIALEIHEDDDDDDPQLSVSSNSGDSVHNSVLSPANRRISRNFSPSKSPAQHNHHSPIANGLDSAHKFEIEKYKAEINRLKESEAEIKALSVNYAALLKEKEDQIGRLSEENSSLKQNPQMSPTQTASRHSSRGSSDQSPIRHHKILAKNHTVGSPTSNGVLPRHDGLSNGESFGREKELADLLEEKNRSLISMQSGYELQIKQLGMELDKERSKLANIETQLKEEQKLNASFQQELNSLKVDKDKMTSDVASIHDEMNQKVAEIQQLRINLHKRDNKEAVEEVEDLKRVIGVLQKENNNLKNDKDKLEASLKESKLLSAVASSSGGNEVQSSAAFPEKEAMEKSLQKLENDLKETRREKDKALLELNRLKQHLLEKEFEESEKMDEDSKVIEELRQNSEYQQAQILHLEKSLKQAVASLEAIKISNDSELKKSKETVDELNKKVASCLNTIEAKNIEVLNLQTALGQYYAEIEAKERLAEDLTAAKEESARLSELLKDAYQQSETLTREKEEVLAKLSEAEERFSVVKIRMNKLEQDNEKLRRALEQSMTRLNRMSLDSDNYVDRRIVVKLLVTYFQRNHSKEVLDLMVRMLGFSDEDKQRMGIAHQGSGKGVVRGVFGLPGRIVGGILGGGSGPANMAPDNQSFADLWVDFLLMETEEREKREAAEASNGQQKGEYGGGLNSSVNQTFPSRGSFQLAEHSDSEFSTVPLTSSETNYQFSRPPPRY